MGIQTGTLQQWLRLEADSLLTSALEMTAQCRSSILGREASPFRDASAPSITRPTRRQTQHLDDDRLPGHRRDHPIRDRAVARRPRLTPEDERARQRCRTTGDARAQAITGLARTATAPGRHPSITGAAAPVPQQLASCRRVALPGRRVSAGSSLIRPRRARTARATAS